MFICICILFIHSYQNYFLIIISLLIFHFYFFFFPDRKCDRLGLRYLFTSLVKVASAILFLIISALNIVVIVLFVVMLFRFVCSTSFSCCLSPSLCLPSSFLPSYGCFILHMLLTCVLDGICELFPHTTWSPFSSYCAGHN